MRPSTKLDEIDLADERVLDRIFFSLAQRKALGRLLLANHRIELTRALSRVAKDGFQEGDADFIHELTLRIVLTADAAGLDRVRNKAVWVQERAACLPDGDKSQEAALLFGGLKLIESILDSARTSMEKSPPVQSLN